MGFDNFAIAIKQRLKSHYSKNQEDGEVGFVCEFTIGTIGVERFYILHI